MGVAGQLHGAENFLDFLDLQYLGKGEFQKYKELPQKNVSFVSKVSKLLNILKVRTKCANILGF